MANPAETLGTDINGKVDFSLPIPVSNQCSNFPLTANGISTVTTPAGFNRAFFAYGVGTNVWVTYDGTSPVVPSTLTTSDQEKEPSVRQIDPAGGQTFKFISDSASFVNIRYDTGASNV